METSKVIEYLQQQSQPIATPLLATALLGPEAKAEDINPTLYSLMSAKLVTKSSGENGRNPCWSLTPSGGLYYEIREMIGQEPIATRTLLQQLGNRITKKELNTLLYLLQSEKVIVKSAKEDGSQPHWARVDPSG